MLSLVIKINFGISFSDLGKSLLMLINSIARASGVV